VFVTKRQGIFASLIFPTASMAPGKAVFSLCKVPLRSIKNAFGMNDIMGLLLILSKDLDITRAEKSLRDGIEFTN